MGLVVIVLKITIKLFVEMQLYYFQGLNAILIDLDPNTFTMTTEFRSVHALYSGYPITEITRIVGS